MLVRVVLVFLDSLKNADLSPQMFGFGFRALVRSLQGVVSGQNQAHGANPNQFVEVEFLKELEDGGFVAKLYGR